uniref:Uncharacterized protein n=1 Tax=Clandestinovirus TaxID=2831644 RepID=A0A8F8KLT7_9VIRU|nr:hypothetical protein KOM_12_496 [Clandestinovirus]
MYHCTFIHVSIHLHINIVPITNMSRANKNETDESLKDTHAPKVTRVTVGNMAYLTKPAKFDVTFCYDDGTKKSVRTTYKSAEKMAKKHNVSLTGESDSDSDWDCDMDSD